MPGEIKAHPSQRGAQPREIGRIVLIVNELSTRGKPMAEQRMTELRQAGLKDILPIKTTGDRDRDIETVEQALEPGDTAAIIGGDGTGHIVVNAAMRRPDIRERISIVPLGGGNGDDLWRSVHGDYGRCTAHDIMTYGARAPVHPIVCRVSSGELAKTCYAALYTSVGYVALCAYKLSSPAYRQKRFYGMSFIRALYEFELLSAQAVKAPPFEVALGDSKDAVQRFDISVINGPRISKLRGIPLSLTEHRLFVSEILSPGAHAVGTALAHLAVHEPAGRYMEPSEALDLHIRSDTWIHCDAEAWPLRANTNVQIQQARDPFYVIGMLAAV